MEDYPRTIEEFERRFSSEEECRADLEAVRWPVGFVCPGVEGESDVRVGRGLYRAWRGRASNSRTALADGGEGGGWRAAPRQALAGPATGAGKNHARQEAELIGKAFTRGGGASPGRLRTHAGRRT